MSEADLVAWMEDNKVIVYVYNSHNFVDFEAFEDAFQIGMRRSFLGRLTNMEKIEAELPLVINEVTLDDELINPLHH